MRITQKQLLKHLRQYNKDYYDYEYKDFILALTAVTEELIKQGHEVNLQNFGTFVPKVNMPLTTYKMREGIMGTYEGSVTMKFVPSISLQQRIRDHSRLPENKHIFEKDGK